MARYSGGITTHRALTGPRKLPYMHHDDVAYKFEVLATLQATTSGTGSTAGGSRRGGTTERGGELRDPRPGVRPH